MNGFAEYKQPANVVRRLVSNRYPRKKPRLLVEGLFSEVAGLPASPIKTMAVEQLKEARKKLADPAKTDASRLQSIVEAEAYYDQAETLLKAANSNVGAVVQAPSLGSAKLSESEKQRQSELATALNKLEEKIATINVAGPAGPAVLPDRRELETSALLGRAATLRQGVAGAVAGQDFDKLKDDIDALQLRAGELQLFVGGAREKVAALVGPQGLLAQGRLAVETMKIEMKGANPAEAKLARLVTALEDATRPSALINPVGIDRLAIALQFEVDAFSKDGGDYVATAAQDIVAAKWTTSGYDLFDEAINPRMLRLESIAGPLEDPSLGEMNQKVAANRGKIPGTVQELGKYPNQGQVVNGLDLLIDEAIKQASQHAETLRQEVAQARIKLDAATNAKTGTLAATQPMVVFASDWKQIDSAMMAIQQMLPGTDPLEGQTLANLLAAKRLCEQAELLVKSVEDNQPKVGTFDSVLQTLETDIKLSSSDKTPLGKYDAAGIKALDEQFKQFKKTQPTLTAAAAQTILDELKKTFDAKKQTAEEVSNCIATVNPDVEKWQGWADRASSLLHGVVKKEFNSLLLKLAPLRAALDAKPPVKADIEKAHQDASGYFTPLSDDTAALNLAKSSEQGLKDKAALVDQQREVLEQRLKVLKERLDTAASRVKEVGGDANPLDTVKGLIKQGETEIKQQPDAAGKTLDRIEQRIDLIYANPEGGLARTRRALPELHQEWVTARQNAAANLKLVLGKLGEYAAPNDEAKHAVERLADRLTEYMVTFTLSADRLEAPMRILAESDTAEPMRRKAREDAVADILDKLRALQAHPMTALLAASPIPEARAAPKRLLDKLDWLQYSIVTSVQ